MIGYVCKYAPAEVFAGFSIGVEQIRPGERDTQGADELIHPNMCSYAKAVLMAALRGNYEAVLMTDCCDALKRVADTLEQQSDIEIYRVSLPRLDDENAAAIYAGEIKKLVQKYTMATQAPFDMEKFTDALRAKADAAPGAHIALMGASAPGWLLDAANEICTLEVRDYTCSQQERSFGSLNVQDADSVMDWYAAQLLGQVPCMRMQDVSARAGIMKDTSIQGIIYHTIKFCDFYGMEFADMDAGAPTLKLETDYSQLSSGQVSTRLQAFFETNGWLKGGGRKKEDVDLDGVDTEKAAAPKQESAALGAAPAPRAAKPAGPYFAGVDSGSTTTNVVIIDADKNIVGMATAMTGARIDASAKAAYGAALKQKQIMPHDVKRIVATGYGRNALRWPDRDVTEITCHARGAHHQFLQARAIIDIGGQDSKIVQIDEDGNVVDFLMNDKCAAGTGRFLEMMAKTLGLSIQEFAQQGLEWKEDIAISSMCAVFAESEVISLISQEKPVGDIIHGLNGSVANRIVNMIARQGADGAYVMTGGVARNTGVIRALEERLGEEILRPKFPEMCGALGAALLAAEK